MIELAYLADHPDAIPTLARWHHAEWGELVRDWTLESAKSELSSHTARRALSTTLVALSDGVLVGSASLLKEDMPDFPPLSPWLGSVFVEPGSRGLGIGGLLVARVIEEARALGVERLYLFTTEARAWYEARGWQVLQPISCQGRAGVIMHLHLGAVPYSLQAGPAEAARNQGEP
ncbi:MAG: GNAT family N-acetyltransferase, partial [Gemmatimonadota bacterium]